MTKHFEPIPIEKQATLAEYFAQMEQARNYLNRAATAYHAALGIYSAPWVDYVEGDNVFELICVFTGTTAKLPLYKKNNNKGAKHGTI